MLHAAPQRLRLAIEGAVQGVGFRPFVYRLAHELGISGWVVNDARGVLLEVEGERLRLERFLERVGSERPPRSVLHRLEPTWLAPCGYEAFEIRTSDRAGAKSVCVLPDVATCPRCLAEVLDVDDRRHRYPFTNCTDCGPRFTIVEELPYDRPNTTMGGFAMCPACRSEYEDPLDRRFHAQPNACPVCGPQLALTTAGGEVLGRRDVALEAAAAAIVDGEVVAVKGLGGFHLMVDAASEVAVARLRRLKGRPTKPLALMVPDLATVERLCHVPPEAVPVLTGPEAPIVLLERLRGSERWAVEGVAPDNPTLGVMLPASPLHHLLLEAVGAPVVATSGNLSEEPIAVDDGEARERLGRIATCLLGHDRPIARHADDSIVEVMAGAPRLLRRARGYAPLPVRLPRRGATLLAVGGHLKTTVGLALDGNAFLSQHIGTMEAPETRAVFERVVADLLRLYEATPEALAVDLHPDYYTRRWALERGARELAGEAAFPLPVVEVQHHHAHLASCLADCGVEAPALGVIFDGTGYGPDGTVWGGELLRGDACGYVRIGHLAPWRLPGGEAAIREPRRSALALLAAVEGLEAAGEVSHPVLETFTEAERRLLVGMLERGVNAPWTTSAGRLFDGVAALAGLVPRASFEGEAAMALEHAVDPDVDDAYPLTVTTSPEGGVILDWRPLVAAVADDTRRRRPVGTVAGRFHNALVEAVGTVAAEVGESRVALSGGCFQNRRLTERLASHLEALGFEVLLHRQVPPNDGGLALGQLVVAAARREEAVSPQEVVPCA